MKIYPHRYILYLSYNITMFHVRKLWYFISNIAGRKIYIKGNENKKIVENSGSVNSHKSHRRFWFQILYITTPTLYCQTGSSFEIG